MPALQYKMDDGKTSWAPMMGFTKGSNWAFQRQALVVLYAHMVGNKGGLDDK